MTDRPRFRLWKNIYGGIAVAENGHCTPQFVITRQEALDLIAALEKVVDADGSKDRPYFSVPRERKAKPDES